MGKIAPSDIFEILFWREVSKNDHSRVEELDFKCPFSQLNLPFYFQKIPFPFFSEFLFYLPFCLLELSLFFQKCLLFSRNTFLFAINVLLFPRIAL